VGTLKHALKGFSHIQEQVEAVGDLKCRGCTSSGPSDILATTVSGDDLYAGVLA
jgi:hypothetical protein